MGAHITQAKRQNLAIGHQKDFLFAAIMPIRGMVYQI